MINLLPDEDKQAIAYARYNSQLRSWIFGAFIGLAGVLLVVLGGQLMINENIDSFDQAIAANKQTLQEQDQKKTLENAKNIQQNFQLAVDVLSREVLFSKLLPRVGQVMPSGTVLENLSLNTESEETAFDLSARAKDINTGSQIQVNLTDPDNKLFQKADLVNISCKTDEENLYPCSVSMRVLPTETNEFLLINPEDKK